MGNFDAADWALCTEMKFTLPTSMCARATNITSLRMRQQAQVLFRGLDMVSSSDGSLEPGSETVTYEVQNPDIGILLARSIVLTSEQAASLTDLKMPDGFGTGCSVFIQRRAMGSGPSRKI